MWKVISLDLGILILDRLIKFLGFNFGFSSFFVLELNADNAFGLSSTTFFILNFLIIVGLLAGVAWFLLKKNTKVAIFGTLLILASLSNLFDRAYYGGVIDVFKISVGLSSLVFNLADILILKNSLIIFSFLSKPIKSRH